jgi:pimeloyl-ACP methyl ester carboxylesterase
MPAPFDGAPPDARALDRRAPEGTPRGLVLMLHGGTPQSLEPVGTRSGSLWRMQVLRDALQRDVLGAGHALWLLRYARRGWNGGTTRSPVPDARWALDQVRAAYGDVPVVLLGHSRGARTAIRVADDPNVRGVVALAPWFDAGDPVAALAGKDLLVAHGLRDRITSARSSRAYTERAAAVAARAEFFPMGGAGHYLLYRPRRWNRFALRHSLDILGPGHSPGRLDATRRSGNELAGP